MKLIEKLKEYENQYMFVHWAMGGEYGKLISVGDDYIEFNIVDAETMVYKETVFIYASLILEVCTGGADVARIIAEISSRMSANNESA